MNDVFAIEVSARWGDMDFNAHMANTAYLDLAVDARLAYFETQGFAASEFARQKFGPVVMEDTIQYYAEIRLRDRVRVTFTLAGLNADGSRFRLRNEFMRGDKLAARLTTLGGWLDLDARKLRAPPPLLDAAMQRLARTDDYAPL